MTQPSAAKNSTASLCEAKSLLVSVLNGRPVTLRLCPLLLESPTRENHLSAPTLSSFLRIPYVSIRSPVILLNSNEYRPNLLNLPS